MKHRVYFGRELTVGFVFYCYKLSVG